MLVVGIVYAEPRASDAQKAISATLEVIPNSIGLDGPRASTQLLVTFRNAEGRLTDMTADATWRAESDHFRIEPSGYVSGVRNGESALNVTAAGQTMRVPVVVRRAD